MSASLSFEECTRFVQNVELPTDLASSRSLAAANYSSFDVSTVDVAAVNYRTLTSFVRDVDDQTKEDILYSTLFAALVADVKHNIHTATKQWYEQYNSTLRALGWATQAFVAYSMGEVNEWNNFSSVDGLVCHLAKKYLPEEKFESFELAVKGLKDGKNAAACGVFNQSSSSANQAGFQIALAVMDGGNAVLKMGYHAYSTDQNIESAFFHTFGNESVAFSYGSQQIVLNHGFYSKIRQTVANRVAQYAIQYILNVELPKLP